jgi:hypothetical protein
MTTLNNDEADLNSTSSHGVRLDLLIKAQDAIFRHVLPALHQTIEEVTNFMYEPDSDDEEIHTYLRELATETVIDELIRLLTRDLVPASRRYTFNDVDGIGIDTLIACHNELETQNVREWFAYSVQTSPEQYKNLLEKLPKQMNM